MKLKNPLINFKNGGHTSGLVTVDQLIAWQILGWVGREFRSLHHHFHKPSKQTKLSYFDKSSAFLMEQENYKK